MKDYKVAFIFTDEYHTPVEGKNYQIGSKEPINETSKPIILYFWKDDYVREWDKGNPKLYESRHGCVIESIKWDGKNLNLSILDYATFSQDTYDFSVGSECITPDNLVQENDYTSPYLITPSKIIVTDKIMDINKDPLGIALREKLEGVWKGADKFTKVAENENFSAESHNYKKCAECSDSVFGLEEEICFECSSFGAETYEDSWEKGVIRLAISSGCFSDEYAEWVERQIDGPNATLNNPRYKEIIDKRWGLNAETFEANAKTGGLVYIITRRCEDYSEYRELDVAGFGSLTEAEKKFNLLFKEAKENNYADETIADAKDYMKYGYYYGGLMSFNDGGMIYELRAVIVGDKGDFYFDAETFESENESFNAEGEIK